ncbi:centrosomal protein of 89 kDa-like [Ylistrum balloti]|uniref:centrosomal protein of 89 kDa-like n=1 Tax=Ylistrum balloti TaxID=509963 RepID=UPI00290595E8|nr:centrosomal protein of 89 kDa-like [Ylistrum balloti]
MSSGESGSGGKSLHSLVANEACAFLTVYSGRARFEMAGKRGKKKKNVRDMERQQSQTGLGITFEKKGTVSAGLLPSVAFMAVPHTPPPATPPGTLPGLAMTTGVLNSSLIGKMLQQHQQQQPGIEDPLSDPESSLYDYQMMEEAGYSSVEFRGGARKRISYSDREKAPTPPLGSREHAVDDEGERMYHILESQEAQKDIYAMPNKTRRSKGSQQSAEEGQSLQQTSQQVREAMRAVRDMDSDSDDVAQETRRFRVTKVTIEHPPSVAPPSSRSEREPSFRGVKFGDPLEIENIQEDSIHETSIKSTRLSARKSQSPMRGEGSKRGIHLINEEAQTGDSLMGPTPHTKGSLSHRSMMSGSNTARSVDELTRSIEGENVLLRSRNEELEGEVHSLQKVSEALDKGDKETAKNLLLKKQLQDMKEENNTLKSSVHRLSVELSSYQAKYRPIQPGEKTGEMLGLPDKGPIPSWLINVQYLSPLFLAYDDRLREKDNVVKHYQGELEKLRIQAEDIIIENQQLHKKLDHAVKRGPIDVTEWDQLKDNAKLVLEENQNLLEQIEVKDQKARDMHQAHVREVSKLSKQLVLIKAEKTEIDQEMEDLRKKYKDTKNKLDALMLETPDKSTTQDYINSIADLKKSMVEKEEAHKDEMDSLKIKLQAVQGERKAQSGRYVELAAENKRLQAEMKAMQKAVRKAQSKIMYLQKAVEQSENKEYTVQEQLANIIRVAEKAAQERDTYAKVLVMRMIYRDNAREQENETKKAVNRLLSGNVTKGKMEEKLKLYKMKAAAKLNTVAGRLKEQDVNFSNQKKEYEREINHLRLLVSEKEKIINNIADDKKDVEEELEVMWRSANTENERMKEVLRHSMKKLRKHEGLSEAMESSEKKELLYVSSDGED